MHSLEMAPLVMSLSIKSAVESHKNPTLSRSVNAAICRKLMFSFQNTTIGIRKTMKSCIMLITAADTTTAGSLTHVYEWDMVQVKST